MNQSAIYSPGTLIADLPGVGSVRATKLRKLGLYTAKDALMHFPRGYKDFSGDHQWGDLLGGKHAAIIGEVTEVSSRTTANGRSMTSLLVQCTGGFIRANWFNMPFLRKKYSEGMHVVVAGIPRRRGSVWEFSHPDIRLLDDGEPSESSDWLAIYPLTAGVQQSHVRIAVQASLDHVVAGLQEALPEDVRVKHNLITIQEAFWGIHKPDDQAILHAARRRLSFADHLIIQLLLQENRRKKEERQAAPAIIVDPRLDDRIRARFPFKFTDAQEVAIRDIKQDMSRTCPMHRLLQGEVGSGKTAVAVYAMLATIANKSASIKKPQHNEWHQAALLAPTELLARQHHRSLSQWLNENNNNNRTQVELLVGGMPQNHKRDVLERVSTGEAAIVIGTHALLAEEVQFRNLAFVVIDEQQRFGVEQRFIMQSGTADPHTLIMTATPIPRTLAHSLYGDLDISEIRQQPMGRQPVRTYHVLPDNLSQWWDFFGKKLRDGRLGYVVVPVIEDSERGLQSIASAYEQLANGPLEAFRLGLVHGKMPSKLQNSTLATFRSGKLDVLVATPVIEVGIDIPQATLMTVLDADCFGLAQLHQLRGRVARGSVPGICGVATEDINERGRTRIEAFVNSDNGFDLAALDHQMRGSGRLFGKEQSGHSGSEFKFKQKVPHTPSTQTDDTDTIPFEEHTIIEEAHQYALTIIADDPSLSLPKHARIRELVEQRRKEQSSQGRHLGSVG